ncbi:MAG: hypothetical protein NVS2B16_24810 [Chloroflexota bacterium]
MIRRLVLALVLGLFVPLATGASAIRSQRSTMSPRAASLPRATYYLALGDSLAFGYQPNGDFSHGYVDDLYASMRASGINHLVNLGCNGETSITFITGDCPHPGLRKAPYTGAQFDAALQFIRSHPGRVKLVTLNLGINDLSASISTSQCIVQANTRQVLATFSTNYALVLSRLRQALGRTGRLVTMTEYDPYENRCATVPQIRDVVQALDVRISRIARKHGVPVADVFTLFGDSTLPNRHLCQYTWKCTPYHDGHPSKRGYAVIAHAFQIAAHAVKSVLTVRPART